MSPQGRGVASGRLLHSTPYLRLCQRKPPSWGLILILFLFYRQDLGVETMELMCVRVLVFFFFPLEKFFLICPVGFPPQLPVFGGAARRGWVWAGAVRKGRAGGGGR